MNNNKFLALILCCLLVSYTNAASQCQLTFYATSPAPVCDPLATTASGEETQNCSVVANGGTQVTMDRANKAWNIAAGNFYEIDFTGTCNCNLIVYHKPDFGGASVSESFSKNKNGIILAFNVWRVPFASYKISCRF